MDNYEANCREYEVRKIDKNNWLDRRENIIKIK